MNVQNNKRTGTVANKICKPEWFAYERVVFAHRVRSKESTGVSNTYDH